MQESAWRHIWLLLLLLQHCWRLRRFSRIAACNRLFRTGACRLSIETTSAATATLHSCNHDSGCAQYQQTSPRSASLADLCFANNGANSSQEHLAGKQFQGWLSIRKKLDELRQKLGPGGSGAAPLPGPPPPSVGRSSRPSEPSRDRDRDRDRDYRRDRDNRDREFEHRGHTSGSRDRDRLGSLDIKLPSLCSCCATTCK